MSFAPGQYITAQRLNRLQPKTYWAQASGTFAASQTNQDVAGTTIPITIETDGATVDVSWAISISGAASPMASLASARVFFGSDSSPVYAVGQYATSGEKGSHAQFWATTVPTAGTFNAKIQATTPASTTFTVYTSIKVVVTEVA